MSAIEALEYLKYRIGLYRNRIANSDMRQGLTIAETEVYKLLKELGDAK